MNEHIVIITGASPLDADLVARLRSDATEHTIWIAVDGGLDHALAAGLEPTHLVGDLDSVTEESLAWAARHAEISRHPTDKDQTDTELALALAVEVRSRAHHARRRRRPARPHLCRRRRTGCAGHRPASRHSMAGGTASTSGCSTAQDRRRCGWCPARRCRCSRSMARARASRFGRHGGNSTSSTSSRSSAWASATRYPQRRTVVRSMSRSRCPVAS